MADKKKGLWANIHAKRKRGEAPAKKGDKNYPETLDIDEGSMETARKNVGADKCWDGYKAKGTKKKDGKTVPNCVKEGKSFAQFCTEASKSADRGHAVALYKDQWKDRDIADYDETHGKKGRAKEMRADAGEDRKRMKELDPNWKHAKYSTGEKKKLKKNQ